MQEPSLTADESLDEILSRLAAVRPADTPLDRTFSQQVYRLLARGFPVRREEVAAAVDRPSATIDRAIDTWQPVIQIDENRRIVGFRGLSVEPTHHRIVIGDVALYTWCAWDTLFLPGVLSERAGVQSRCPHTAHPIAFSIDRTGSLNGSHLPAAISFPTPKLDAMRSNLRRHFCRQIHFFPSMDIGRVWARMHRTMIVDIDRALALGRARLAAILGELADDPPSLGDKVVAR